MAIPKSAVKIRQIPPEATGPRAGTWIIEVGRVHLDLHDEASRICPVGEPHYWQTREEAEAFAQKYLLRKSE